jgi:hypothetical protein
VSGRVPGPAPDPVTHVDRAVQGCPGASRWPRAQRDCRGDPARFAAVSLPARRRDGQPARGRIRLALPAGRPLGRSEAGHRPPRPARRDRSPAKPARLSLIAGHAPPDRIRTSSQPDPARSMTRIRQPDSGKPRAHQIVWETGDAQGSAAGAGKSAAIWMTWPLTASEPPRLRVVWCGRTRLPPGFSVVLSSGS